MMSLNVYPYPQARNIVRLAPTASKPSKSVKVIVPCYNEAARLDTTAFRSYLSSRSLVDFVFVDDGSHDQTLAVLSSISADHPDRVEVLSLDQNSGKAEAVRQGLLYATQSGAKFVGYWDADLATPLDAIEDLVRIGERYEEVEVVYGARRMLLGHRVKRTWRRRAVSKICSSLARIAVRLPIGDTQCGAKIIRNSPRLADKLSKPFSAGWLFDVELFARLRSSTKNSNTQFYEHPLAEWTEVAGSKVSVRAIIRSGFAMLRIIAESRLGWAEATKHDHPEPTVRIVSAYQHMFEAA